MGVLAAIDPRYTLSGFLVGLLVGQTGVGGGSLMTPLLMLAFGIHPATAVGTDLLFASVTKSVGTLVHGLNRTVDWRITRRLATGSLPATAVTLLILAKVDLHSAVQERVIPGVLSAMLLLTALALFFRPFLLGAAAPVLSPLNPRRSAWLTVLVGAALGILVTISSVGAGALGVTALLLLYPAAPLAVIVGSDIAHAVPLTLAAGIGHWWIGSVDPGLLSSLLSGSIPGVILGSWLAARVSDTVLRPILATCGFRRSRPGTPKSCRPSF